MAAEERIKRPLLKFMLSLVLRHSIKKALVGDNFTEGILKHFGDSSSTKVKTIGDPALFLKEWESSSGSNKRMRAIALCLIMRQKSLLVLEI